MVSECAASGAVPVNPMMWPVKPAGWSRISEPVPPANVTDSLDAALSSRLPPLAIVANVGTTVLSLTTKVLLAVPDSAGALAEAPDTPKTGGSVISVPPLPSDAKYSAELKLSKVKLALWMPSDTVSNPFEELYDSAN